MQAGINHILSGCCPFRSINQFDLVFGKPSIWFTDDFILVLCSFDGLIKMNSLGLPEDMHGCVRLTLHCCRFVLNNVWQLNPLQQVGNEDGRRKTKSRKHRTELKIDCAMLYAPAYVTDMSSGCHAHPAGTPPLPISRIVTVSSGRWPSTCI